MAFLIEVSAIIVAPVVAVMILVLFDERNNVTKALAIASMLLIFIGGEVARRAYFRCPVCGDKLPRGQRHVQRLGDLCKGRCSSCKTDFDTRLC